MEETIKIKGMVCRRCIAVVKDIFMNNGFEITTINLGTVQVMPPLGNLEQVKKQLQEEGFEILSSKQSQIVSRVKSIVKDFDHTQKLSTIICEAIPMDYDAISALFTQTEGLTIEKYYIQHRIKKAKQLLSNTHFPLTEIAYQLGYSSLNYFSNQFKKETGLSPSTYKKLMKT
jgi:AraC family transcriptional regulator